MVIVPLWCSAVRSACSAPCIPCCRVSAVPPNIGRRRSPRDAAERTLPCRPHPCFCLPTYCVRRRRRALFWLSGTPKGQRHPPPAPTMARSSSASLFGEPGRLPYPRAERSKARPSRSRPSRLSMSRLRYPLHVGITGKNREGRTQVSEIRRESESECLPGLFETRDEIAARRLVGWPPRRP